MITFLTFMGVFTSVSIVLLNAVLGSAPPRPLDVCSHSHAIEVTSTVTGQKVADWCPDCERQWYWLPYVSGRAA